MRTGGAFGLTVAALLATWPLAAQPPAEKQAAAEEEEPIVVTGQVAPPPSRSTVAEQARALAGASKRYDENLARYLTPICPDAQGLKRAAAQALVARIRENGGRLGVPMAKGRCRPNLIIAFVDDGLDQLARMERSQPELFAAIPAADRAEMMREEAPVRVWSNVLTLNTKTGRPVERHKDGTEALPTVWGQLNRWFVSFQRNIVSTVIIFDRAAVADMSLLQLADYATMRGFARMRPASGDEPMATILALFSPREPRPDALTAFDRGYISALYWERPDEAAVSKLLRVRKAAQRAREDVSAQP